MVVVVVTDRVIVIEDAEKCPTLVEFVFRTTVATNMFVVIFDVFVAPFQLLGR